LTGADEWFPFDITADDICVVIVLFALIVCRLEINCNAVVGDVICMAFMAACENGRFCSLSQSCGFESVAFIFTPPNLN